MNVFLTDGLDVFEYLQSLKEAFGDFQDLDDELLQSEKAMMLVLLLYLIVHFQI